MVLESFSLHGKVAIVTGASYGLGVVFAAALADAGAHIVAAARSLDKLQDTKALIEAKGVRCLTVRCDVTDRADVRNLMGETHRAFGTIDILVNNAGISSAAGIRPEFEIEQVWRDVIDVDLNGLWWCCQEAAQYMLRQGQGSIINISSIFGSGGFGGGSPAAYFAAKGGVNNLTEFLATVWGDRGVRVNAIAPTFFDSEMIHEALEQGGVLDMLTKRHPMGRIGDHSDLAGPVVFLASEASKFVNGIILRVDGGYGASRGFHPGPYPSDAWDPQGRGHPLLPGSPWDGPGGIRP
jgi:NAD(P)-dependent dehydrogenase (short-subunit alcohol dehydrogenase family)